MMLAFVRTLAVVGSATLLVIVAMFAAVQGALDGNPLTLAYWTKWWPIWLILVPTAIAFILSLTGRAAPPLAWIAAILLLIGAMVVMRLAIIG